MTAIQDRMPGNHCYGCGPDNPLGMQIKSHWVGDESICHYWPKAEQCAGPTHFVYGGTIASLIDCHCVCTATSNYYRSEDRETGEAPEIWCVTGKLEVRYLAPTPIDQEIELRATVVEFGERKTLIKCRVYSDGVQTAEGDVVAVRVADSWRSP